MQRRIGQIAKLLIAASIVLPSSLSIAEKIIIPVGKQKESSAATPHPTRGQSSSLVLSRFGEPVQRFAARGEPPISRWEYPSFVVFFESGYVIHSVFKHRPAVPAE